MNSAAFSNNRAWTLVFLAWLLACFATLGSLFFSEVMKYPPCVLCWYQRVCVYPLTAILLAGLFPFEPKVLRFSLPLTVIGWVIALYHNLLYYGIVPESAAPCVQGVSCTEVHFELISIPLMSLIGFTLIAALLILTKRSLHEE